MLREILVFHWSLRNRVRSHLGAMSGFCLSDDRGLQTPLEGNLATISGRIP
jgi:hypothetical protein